MSRPVPLQRGCYYHVYNRGNNWENIFREQRNYQHFLRLYARHVEPIAETYAYCLMRNHFHFLVRIKELTDLNSSQNLSGPKRPSQSFSNLFNAYSKAFNKAYERSGALFQRPFGRIKVTSDAYFASLVIYIHQNPQKHGFVDDFRDWTYSSYSAHLAHLPTRVRRDDVLAWFGGLRGFERSHRQEANSQALGPLVTDDFL